MSIKHDDNGLLNSIDIPIIIVSRERRVERINRAATIVLGLSGGDVNESLASIFPGVENLDALCAQVMADGVSCRQEASRGDRTFLLHIAAHLASDGQMLGAVLAFSNVTWFRASIDQAVYEREYTEAILNVVIDPLLVLDEKLQVQTANRAFYELFAISSDETQAISIRKLGDRVWEASEVWDSLKTILSEHPQFHSVEIEREFPGRGRRTLLLDARRLTQAGRLILLTLHDITERQQAERTTSLLAAIVGSSDDAIVSKNLDGTITSWNKSAERLFGYTAEEAVGRHITLIVPWDRRSEEDEILRRLARGERVDHFETVRRRKDGSTLEVSLTISPVRDGTGKVVGASKVARDVSERKRIERAMRESEERFRALVTSSSDVVYRMNPDWSEMRQLDSQGFISISDTGKLTKEWLNEYIHPDDQQLMLRTLRDAVRKKSTFQLEHRVRRKDGRIGWANSRAVPLFGANGEIVEWFGAATDVTDRKESEEKYRQLAKSLDAEVRARTRDLEAQAKQLRELSWRLLRTQEDERRHIARELHDSAGQTLTVLGIGLAQVLQETGRRAPEVAAKIELVQEMVQQLHREIRTASYLLHPPLLDETGLHSALSWYVQGLVDRSGLDVRLEIPEDFGRLPGEMELVIFRLVQECLTNIHRHAESKTASIRMNCEATQITIDIQDQGKGMSAERLAEIQAGNSGMGIRGMRERLSQFDGTVTIQSNGCGTRVLAIIPVPRSNAANEEKAAMPLPTAV